jgi:hypothetical protein
MVPFLLVPLWTFGASLFLEGPPHPACIALASSLVLVKGLETRLISLVVSISTSHDQSPHPVSSKVGHESPIPQAHERLEKALLSLSTELTC